MLRINGLQSAMIRPPETAMMPKASYANLTIPELRQILKSKGLSTAGNKAELIRRCVN